MNYKKSQMTLYSIPLFFLYNPVNQCAKVNDNISNTRYIDIKRKAPSRSPNINRVEIHNGFTVLTKFIPPFVLRDKFFYPHHLDG